MKAFYGSRISDHMTLTPEGFLVCHDVPIARTGVQQYRGAELEILDDPEGIFDVHRTDDEVFSRAAIASFEGKPICDEHPNASVTPSNSSTFVKGHVQNVRRGTGDDADKLVADLFITDESLIQRIQDGKREISCGYDCDYNEIDGTLYQQRIEGNHVAVVESGRAGSDVCIRDSKQPIQAQNERGTRRMSNRPKQRAGASGKVGTAMAKLFRIASKDADPEEIADAAEALMDAGEEVATDEDIETVGVAPTPPQEAPPVAIDSDTASQIMAALASLTQEVAQLRAGSSDNDPLAKLEDELTAPESEQSVTIPVAEMDEDTTEDDDETADEDGIEDEDGTEDEDTTEDEDGIEDDDPTVDEDGVVVAPEDRPENPLPAADRAMRRAMLNMVRTMKPIVAKLPPAQRKRVSDSMARNMRVVMGKPAKAKKNGYASVQRAAQTRARTATQDSARQLERADAKLGDELKRKYNPHYQTKK